MSDEAAWSLRRDADGVAWLTLDKPGASANTLGRAILEELGQWVGELERTPPRGLVLRSGKSSGFIVGADIHEFTAFKDQAIALAASRLGQSVLARLAALPCPTVAAIHGFALGGGLEVALACRYRVAVGDVRLALGLPEVQLGIQPGFGGTVRGVQLLGVRPAMELMLTGKSVRAERALAIGLVDKLVSASELDAAARQLIIDAPPPHRPPLLEQLLNLPGVRALLKPVLLRQVARRARRDHYPAPFAIVELWARHGARGAAAYEAEAQSIARLFDTETAHGLVRVFLLQERLKSLGGKSAQAAQHVHVVGAGVMGGDIAAWCALRGLEVSLQDRELKFIQPAMQRADALFTKRIKDAAERARTSARLQADAAGDGMIRADVMIEAIFEDLQAKRALFVAAEPRLPATAILATNTSSIPLEEMAGALNDAGRLVGLHFFNPVAQMPLVEVIHSTTTRPEVLTQALTFARRIDKLPLPCRSSPGFLVNRVLFPYLHEALHAAGAGIPLAVIDRAAEDFGMPMGPIELADVVGLDVVLHVGEIITRELRRDEPSFVAELRSRVAARQLGRKSGAGLYPWHDGRARKSQVTAAVPEDLADRLILAMLNECVACLREQVVADADLVDAGVIFGTGFAPFRGGPLYYARRRGIPTVMARLRQLAERHGPRFNPDPGWSQLVD